MRVAGESRLDRPARRGRPEGGAAGRRNQARRSNVGRDGFGMYTCARQLFAIGPTLSAMTRRVSDAVPSVVNSRVVLSRCVARAMARAWRRRVSAVRTWFTRRRWAPFRCRTLLPGQTEVFASASAAERGLVHPRRGTTSNVPRKSALRIVDRRRQNYIDAASVLDLF